MMPSGNKKMHCHSPHANYSWVEMHGMGEIDLMDYDPLSVRRLQRRIISAAPFRGCVA